MPFCKDQSPDAGTIAATPATSPMLTDSNWRHLSQALVDAMPHPGFVVNPRMQVLLANQAALDWVGKVRLSPNRPQRIDELIQAREICCLNQDDVPSCLVREVIPETLYLKHATHTEDLEIIDLYGHSQHMKLVARPIKLHSSTLFLFSLIDNNLEKRKQLMDQLFFHDIANTTSELLCNAELLSHPAHKEGMDMERREAVIETVYELAREMASEIRSQKNILAHDGKRADLIPEELNSLRELQCLKRYFEAEAAEREVHINIEPGSRNIRFQSDAVQLRRVLMNMLKNACQASLAGDVVTLGCELAPHLGVQFWVHNPCPINEQALQRFTSTRIQSSGLTHGLGTYSIRLLTERYLHGSLNIETSDSLGSKVSVRYPLNWPGRK